MVDASFPDTEEWTPVEGFDGLPIPGVPPSAQPGMQRSPALLPAHGGPRPVDRPAVERTPQNLSFEPGAIAVTEPYFGPSLGADAATPAPVVAPENGHSLGLALLLVTVGAGVGLKVGGTMGGVSGGLFGGAAVNAFRAARCVTLGTAEADKEALVSGTWAILTAALGGYLAYQEHKKAPVAAKRNKSEQHAAEEDEPEESDEDEPEPEDEPEEEEDES